MTVFTDSGLNSSVQYDYRVRSLNTNTNASLATATFTKPAGNTPPSFRNPPTIEYIGPGFADYEVSILGVVDTNASGGTDSTSFPLTVRILTNGVLAVTSSYQAAEIFDIKTIILNLNPGTNRITLVLVDSYGLVSTNHVFPDFLVAKALGIADAYPYNNPLKNFACLEVGVVPAGTVVRVYNVLGMQVDQEFTAGDDGVARNNNICAGLASPGIYIIVMEAPDGTKERRKLIITGSTGE